VHAIEPKYEAFQKGEVDRVGAVVHRVVKEVNHGEQVAVREGEIKKGEPLGTYGDCAEQTLQANSYIIQFSRLFCEI
jgi:hypothetical protein